MTELLLVAPATEAVGTVEEEAELSNDMTTVRWEDRSYAAEVLLEGGVWRVLVEGGMDERYCHYGLASRFVSGFKK